MSDAKMRICCVCSKIRLSGSNHDVGPRLLVEIGSDAGMERDHALCPDCCPYYESTVTPAMHSRCDDDSFPGSRSQGRPLKQHVFSFRRGRVKLSSLPALHVFH